jgi:hypothetical protein
VRKVPEPGSRAIGLRYSSSSPFREWNGADFFAVSEGGLLPPAPGQELHPDTGVVFDGPQHSFALILIGRSLGQKVHQLVVT